MIAFRPDSSFPFLKIAREHEVPYGTVLFIAERIEDGTLWMTVDYLIESIADAVDAERQRRATIIHNARHTGDAP